MPTLHIKNIHCNETEDNTGGDECELRVWCDDRRYGFRYDMNDGDDWPIDVKLPFTRRAKIQLWDLDLGNWLDRHDWLGTVVLRPEPIDGGEGTFNQDGADYVMEYDVLAT